MNKYFTISLLISFIGILGYNHHLIAQPVIEWQKTFGGSGFDIAYSAQQTSEGGYIIAGETDSSDGDVSSNNGNIDYWIVKTDQNGLLEWEKTYGGSHRDNAKAIIQTNAGGVYCWGPKSFH